MITLSFLYPCVDLLLNSSDFLNNYKSLVAARDALAAARTALAAEQNTAGNSANKERGSGDISSDSPNNNNQFNLLPSSKILQIQNIAQDLVRVSEPGVCFHYVFIYMCVYM